MNKEHIDHFSIVKALPEASFKREEFVLNVALQ